MLLLHLLVVSAHAQVSDPDTPTRGPFAEALHELEVLDGHGYIEEGAARVILALDAHADHEGAPQVRLGLSRFLRARGRGEAELRVLDRGVEAHPAWAPWFRLASLDAALQQQDFEGINRRFEAAGAWSGSGADAAHFYGAWGRLGTGDVEAGRTLLAKVRGPLQDEARSFSDHANFDGVRHRSAGAATILSVVPGLGHAYVGAWGGALTSVVVNGGLGALSGVLLLKEEPEPLVGGVVLAVTGASMLSFAADAGRRADRFNRKERGQRIESWISRWWLRATPTGRADAPLTVETVEQRAQPR